MAGLLAAPAPALFTTVRYCLEPQGAAKTQLRAAPSNTRHSKEEPEPFSVAATVEIVETVRYSDLQEEPELLRAVPNGP